MTKHTYGDLVALIDANLSDPLAKALVWFLSGLKGLPDAPASGALRYHHAYNGGLIDHIVDVFKIAVDLNTTRTANSPVPQIHQEEILLVAVLHDIHKVQDASGNICYVPNILKSGKRSEAEPFEKSARYLTQPSDTPSASSVEREFLYREAVDRIPGGIKSLALIKALAPDLFAALSDDVKLAIRYHDGAYAHSKYELAGKETPLMILLHCADMLSSRLNRLK